MKGSAMNSIQILIRNDETTATVSFGDIPGETGTGAPTCYVTWGHMSLNHVGAHYYDTFRRITSMGGTIIGDAIVGLIRDPDDRRGDRQDRLYHAAMAHLCHLVEHGLTPDDLMGMPHPIDSSAQS